MENNQIVPDPIGGLKCYITVNDYNLALWFLCYFEDFIGNCFVCKGALGTAGNGNHQGGCKELLLWYSADLGSLGPQSWTFKTIFSAVSFEMLRFYKIHSIFCQFYQDFIVAPSVLSTHMICLLIYLSPYNIPEMNIWGFRSLCVNWQSFQSICDRK